MRMLLFFDLPTETLEDKRTYRQFRRFLINEGFLMHQYSVYSKLLLNQSAATAMLARLQEKKPKAGAVSVLIVTEKQFSRMVYLTGSVNTHVANSDSRLVFLGEDYSDES